MKSIFRIAVLILLFVFSFINIVEAQWVQSLQLNELNDGDVNSLAVIDTNLFAGTGIGVFSTADNGKNWTQVNFGLEPGVTDISVQSLAVIGTELFAGTYGSGVYFSANNGGIWTSTGPTNVFVMPLAVSGMNLFAGTDRGVFISTDKGGNWIAVDSGLADTHIMSFAVSDTNLFAGTETGGVFLSTNNGTTWNAINNNLLNLTIHSLAVIGTNVFAGTDNGVWLSTDNGKNWKSAGLSQISIRSLAIIGTNVFAGSDLSGVFVSTDKGTSWKSAGLPNSRVLSFAVIDTNLFAGTDSGIWRSTLSEIITGITDTKNNLPTHFSLSQNYPNPFNPTTTIRYSIERSSFVSLEIYNSLGQLVKNLVNEVKSPGNYSITLNASNLGSGVYFYRIHAGSFVQTKKLLLLK